MTGPSEAVGNPRPKDVWLPTSVHVYPVKRVATKAGVAWDVRFRVDVWEFKIRHSQKGHATDTAARLQHGHRQGFPFDPSRRQFIDPSAITAFARDDAENSLTAGPTVVELASAFFADRAPRKQPATRQHMAHSLACAVVYFLDCPTPDGPVRRHRPGMPTTERDFALAYLRRCVFALVPEEPSEQDLRWRTWFGAHSMRMSDLTPRMVREYLATLTWCVDHEGARTMRSRQSLRLQFGYFQRACRWGRKNDLIAVDPTATIDREDLAGGHETTERVDPQRLLTPAQRRGLITLAGAVPKHGGDRFAAFVAVGACCGARQGEALAVRA